MKKITNKQLNQLAELTAKKTLEMLEKIRITCPKTMSGKHYWERNNWKGEKWCMYCHTRKNK